jgi:hypothetical protein
MPTLKFILPDMNFLQHLQQHPTQRSCMRLPHIVLPTTHKKRIHDPQDESCLQGCAFSHFTTMVWFGLVWWDSLSDDHLPNVYTKMVATTKMHSYLLCIQ